MAYITTKSIGENPKEEASAEGGGFYALSDTAQIIKKGENIISFGRLRSSGSAFLFTRGSENIYILTPGLYRVFYRIILPSVPDAFGEFAIGLKLGGRWLFESAVGERAPYRAVLPVSNEFSLRVSGKACLNLAVFSDLAEPVPLSTRLAGVEITNAAIAIHQFNLT